MLQRLYVDNYKCLVNFNLPLQELSLLLGPNGAGKTSVLDIVFVLHRLLGVCGDGGLTSETHRRRTDDHDENVAFGRETWH